MGAIPFDGGTMFRVWAPHATAVFVSGPLDEWAQDRTPLARDGDGASGTWSADVEDVRPGAEYRFTIRTPEGDLSRLDPYARQLTNSIGNAVAGTIPAPNRSVMHSQSGEQRGLPAR